MVDLATEKPISIIQAAVMFGVHRKTIDNWITAGLVSFKMRGRRFTTIQALNRFQTFDSAIPPSSKETNHDVDEAMRQLEALSPRNLRVKGVHRNGPCSSEVRSQ